MPGVYTHGTFDTWSPGYLMFMAAMHNGVSRLYETFGNAGADTEVRELDADDTARTWYRQDPPYPTVTWSQRNNNNYEQTGLLVSLAFAAENRELLLRNFWAKGKRSIEKPKREGPAAYVLAGDPKRPAAQAELLRVLQLQHVEITRADKAFTVALPETKDEGGRATAKKGTKGKKDAKKAKEASRAHDPPSRRPYIVRMDQPYSRIADAPRPPVLEPGRSAEAPLRRHRLEPRRPDSEPAGSPTRGPSRPPKPVTGRSGRRGKSAAGSHLIVQRGDDALFTPLPAGDATVEAAAEPFAPAARLPAAPGSCRRPADACRRPRPSWESRRGCHRPYVKTRPVGKPRLALLHTWQWTQTEGWWRQRLDLIGVPYDYISTQDVAAEADLRSRYDAILFPPVGFGNPQLIVSGMPMWGNPLPWKQTAETPNLGHRRPTTCAPASASRASSTCSASCARAER
jgi:hypothetical protein